MVFKERGVFIIIVIFVMNTLNEDLVKWGSKPIKTFDG